MSENGQVSLDSHNICWRDLKVVVNIQVTEFVKVLQISFARYLMAQTVKNLPAMWEMWVHSLGWEGPLEKRMATHTSILTWRIPWRQEPSGLQSTGCKESDTTVWLSVSV